MASHARTVVARPALVLEARWFGYAFGLVAVLLTTTLLAEVAPTRLANVSVLYALPILLTASLYGRAPALVASAVAFVAFEWFFAAARLDPSHLPTLSMFLVTALVAGQLATTLREQAIAARKREREALVLYAIARMVPGSTLELQPLLRAMLDQLMTIVDYDAAAVVLRDQDAEAVVLEYRGPLARERLVGLRVQEGTPIRDLLLPVPNHTELTVPLTIKGRMIGTQILLRSSAGASAYSARDAELATVFGQHAAVAIDNARLYGELRDRFNELVGLQQVGAMLLEERDFDRLLHAIGLQLQALTHADAVALGLIDETQQFFEVRATVGEVPPAPLVGARVAVDASFVGEGVLSVAMRTRQQIVGTISIYPKRDAPGFTDRDAELAALFAQLAAVAIENAWLYEAARGRAALEERQRLARELHDSVSQALFGIALNASAADELFEAAPDRALELLGQVLRLAEAALTEMRALIFELRPESLEQEGLVGALEKQVAAVQARNGLQAHLTVGAEPDLPLVSREVLYRVAQEALHNAGRHARARTLDVALEVGEAEVTLVVADDGRGFQFDANASQQSGLRSIRERVTALGGTLDIQSAPGAGTRLTARVPRVDPGIRA